MIRGRWCYWFWRVNPGDGRPIRKCRHGSLCRFQHLTRRETEEILNEMSKPENTASGCPHCDGSGQMTIRVENMDGDGTTTRDYTMLCIGCRGRGSLDGEARIRAVCDRAHARDWCECEERPIGGIRYHPDNTHPKCSKRCYTCTVCRCLTQIG